MARVLPVDVMFSSLEKPLALPQPGEITPSEITLKRRPDGRVEPARVRLAITGTGLDGVDLGKIEVAEGAAVVRKAELVSGTLLVEVEVRSAKAPALVLRLGVYPGTVGLSSGAAAPVVLTRPVMLSVR